MSSELHIIGGGLAGTEAAWQAASLGIEVVLYEMRPTRKTEVHKTETLAELVCSNSFRSDDHQSNAVGVLHQEMRMMNSLIMQIADLHKVPAGGALAVDRELFASEVEHRIASHPNITLKREEITSLDNPDWENIIIATGPLTAEPLAEAIKAKTGEADLAFFDAIAPIVYFETINMDIAWFQSRYDKGDGKDYINCPMNKSQYEAFIEALNAGDKMMFKEWEENTPYFDGCMPIEIMDSRGPETLRFGPMKPVGLTNAHDKSRPYAVVQLRQDNKLGSLFNIVGFQTKLKYAEQTRIFRMIPGLEEAEFARLGGLHRNTFINTPRLLDAQLRLRSYPKIRFAGQITGVEGYVESAAIGGMAGKMAAYETLAKQWHSPPEDTAHGALLTHLTSGAVSDSFQPMNVNFGLFPPLLNADSKSRKLRGRDRKAAYASRSLSSMEQFLEVQSR
jgi:methylenetetrahydrofolate--tRNA-(uracil-5-)-methyltransferase